MASSGAPASVLVGAEVSKGFRKFSASDSTTININALVAEGGLPPQTVLEWRAPAANEVPLIVSDQHVVFRWMFECRLGLPCCSFFRALLHYYGIEFVNLNVNSLLHISIFIHLCKAFIGIRPHFDLFRVLFAVRPLTNSKDRTTIGGIGVQVRK